MSKRKSIMASSLVVAMLLYLIDTLVDYLFFYDESFINLLFLSVPPNELFTRSYILIFTLGFGYFTIRLTESMGARKASEKLYRSLVETTAAIPWEVDLETLRYTYIGPRVVKLLGYPYEAWTDIEFWAARVHPNDREFAVSFCQSTANRSGDHEFNYRMIKADGGIIWVRDIVFVQKKRGRPPMLRGFLFDITKFKDAEVERLKLEAQLRQVQKMEAVGRLAGGIAHDFNNYLTTILGFGELLLMNYPENHPNRSNVDEILGAAEKASALTRSLLAFSRKQAMAPRPVDLNEVVGGIRNIVARLLGEEIRLTFRPAAEKIIVNADPGQLEQVIMNMTSNAKDAMPNGGVFVIEVSGRTIDQAFIEHHGYGTPGHYGQISFNDTGSGMDAATREKIFEPFFTTKEKGKGTGLGMSIVHGIIKQHEGFININSNPGMGTTFKVLLPSSQDETATASGTKTLPARPIDQGGKNEEVILLAEDEQSVRRLLTTILVEAGYRIIQAVDGSEAIARFTEARQEIALVILDAMMPNMSGKEVMNFTRQLDPETKILFISGYPADTIRNKGILGQEVDFLSKPIMPTVLLNKVRQILDR